MDLFAGLGVADDYAVALQGVLRRLDPADSQAVLLDDYLDYRVRYDIVQVVGDDEPLRDLLPSTFIG